MCTISRVRAGKERGQRLEKRDHSLGMPHGDDCALWLGSLSRFVQPSRTARYSGLAGQSPLPEKDPHDLEGTRWRLRLLAGQVSGFVPMLRTHHTMGVSGSDVVLARHANRLAAA